MSNPAHIPPEGALPDEGVESAALDRDFINSGSRFMLVDNVSKVLGPLLMLLCAKLYAGGDWGFFKYYESVLLLLTRLAAVGMDRGVVWIYAQRGGDASFVRVFSRAVNFVVLFAVLLALLAGAQWLGWFPAWSGLSHAAPGAGGFNIACYLASIPFQAATLLLLQAMLNKRRLLPQALVRNVAVPLASFGPAALLAFTPLKAHGLAVPYLFGSVLGFGLALFYFLRAFPMGKREWSGSAKVPGDMIRFSLPLASTDFAMSLAYRMDILLLARFVGLEAVEVYSVILMIANTLKSVRQSFDGIMLSVFSRAKSTLPTPAQIRHFNYANWMVLNLQLPFLPLALLFGGELLGLVSPLYAGGGIILALAIFFNLWSTPGAFSSQFVAGLGRTWFIPAAQAIFFAISLGMNLLLIPRFGMTGAVIATGVAGLVSSMVPLVGVAWFSKKIFLGEYWRPFMFGVLLLVPAMVTGIWFQAALFPRIALLTVSTGLFGLFTHARWKRFNAADAKRG